MKAHDKRWSVIHFFFIFFARKGPNKVHSSIKAPFKYSNNVALRQKVRRLCRFLLGIILEDSSN